MRPAAILVPLGVALAIGGGIMLYASAKTAPAPTTVISPVGGTEVRHPVSKEMLQMAALMAERAAPFFKLRDAHDIEVQIGGEGKKPQFVYFVLDGCPCSLNAQPLFNRLYARFKDKVDFIAVTSGDKSKAIDFAGTTTLLHPIVADPELKIMKAFGARQSTYSLIVRPNGTVLKVWPGYSEPVLQEINRRLAELTKTKEEEFTAGYAPKKIESGCYFY